VTEPISVKETLQIFIAIDSQYRYCSCASLMEALIYSALPAPGQDAPA
jgi:hypothetical protein